MKVEIRNLSNSKIEDPQQNPFDAILQGVEPKTCSEYLYPLFTRYKAEIEAGNEELAYEIQVLYRACSIKIDLESINQEVDGYDLTVFSPDDFLTLEKLAITIQDSELSARVYDLIRYNARNIGSGNFYKYTLKTITNYLQSAKDLESVDLLYANDRYIRALKVASQLGRTHPEFTATFNTVEQFANKLLNKTFTFPSIDELVAGCNLTQVFIDLDQGSPTVYINLLQNLSSGSDLMLTNPDAATMHRYFIYTWQSALLELESQWHHMNSDIPSKERSFLQSIFIKSKKFVEDGLDKKYMNTGEAILHTRQGINLLRDPGSRKPKLREMILPTNLQLNLRKQLLNLQKVSSTEPDRTSSFFDDFLKLRPDGYEQSNIDSLYAEGRAFSEGMNFEQALNALLNVNLIPIRSDLEKQITQRDIFIPTVVIDLEEKQRGVGRVEDGVEYILFHKARIQQTKNAIFINGALNQVRDLSGSLELPENFLESSFIPESRITIYEQAFNSLFTGDFYSASHLLLPQIEESLRYVLTQANVIPANLTKEQIQANFTLNNLLYDDTYKTELVKIFGEELVFNLQGILVERFGSNFRNVILHGLLTDGQMQVIGSEVIYLSWLTLKMCELSDTYLGKPSRSKPTFNRIESNDVNFNKGENLVNNDSVHEILLRLSDSLEPNDYSALTKLAFVNFGMPEEEIMRKFLINVSKPQNNVNAQVWRGAIKELNNKNEIEPLIKILILDTAVNSNLFIPDTNKYFWAKGLAHALVGENVKAAHILIPQLEKSIRHLISQDEHITSFLDDEYTQDDYPLNKLFSEFREELIMSLGEDLFYDLESLTISPEINLRNLLSHGLLEEEDFTSDEMSNLLALILKVSTKFIRRLHTVT